MKQSEATEKIKASIRKHYVRKKQLDALKKEVQRLRKRITKLEKSSEDSEIRATKALAKENKNLDSPKSPKSKKTTAAKDLDKLTLIKGIGPVLEKKLNGIGIVRIAQIADWGQKEIDAFSAQLNFKGRIEREEWVRQARELVTA